MTMPLSEQLDQLRRKMEANVAILEAAVPLIIAERDCLQAEVERLQKCEEHGWLLRNAVESIGVGGARMTPREATLRGQCRLLVKAFDEGVL